MENSKSHKIFFTFFPLVFLILGGITIFYLDLAGGPVWTLVLGISMIVVLLVGSLLLLNAKAGIRFIPWALFIVGAVVIAFAAKPDVLPKPAVRNANPEKTAVLAIRDGNIQGVYNEDKSVEVYAGIPYAEVPARWKEPVKPTPWTGVKDCSYFAPKSYQQASNCVVDSVIDIYAEKSWHPDFTMYPEQERSEDSLFLNVWKPASATLESKLPVLFYIHGGSLTGGTSAGDDYNGETFARNGVLMITIAYRLGVFGYFAHPDLAAESPNGTTGNYGLLDQIEALKWARDNVASFGGDPDNITIAGESAGSSSVSALCASPLCKEGGKSLFKNAIGESSSLAVQEAPHTFRTKEAAMSMGKKIMDEFGCKSIEELRKIPAEKLVNTKFKNSAMTLDPYALPKTPYEVYKEGSSNETNLLHGYNVREADAFVIPETLFSPTNKNNIKERLAKTFGDKIAEKMCLAYADKIEKDAFSAYNEIISVYWFIYPHHSWSNLAVAEGKKVYRYQFLKENGYYGTYHSGEIIYAYGNLYRSRHGFAYNDKDKELSDRMVTYWTSFVKTGSPNPLGEAISWEPCLADQQKVMGLGEEVKMIPDPYTPLYPLIEEFMNLPPNQRPSAN